ncbi:MAG: helix-hairpin-helix domain-containing protein [Bacteroidales bacterium]|nr:helix-hairpin-helix domain-containing protein [Bacteroidales bacterium]
MSDKKEGKKVSASFATGVVALVFLAVGYQTALFIHHAAIVKISADRDTPDTVFIYETAAGNHPPAEASGPAVKRRTERRSGRHMAASVAVRKNTEKRSYECFEFDPNTASEEELSRLGFSRKQAAAICNYREKGGRFRRKEDFAKSYVVADSVYERLEPYIRIPKVDINLADSAAFDALPGIGPWFAAKMVSYRSELHGYSYPEQLMDIYHFDQEKFDGLKDLITVSEPAPYPLWALPEDSLRRHPYIRSRAHGVIVFRENNPPGALTPEALAAAGVLSPENAAKLSKCRLAPPDF